MRFQCTSCEKILRINDSLAGTRIKCPACGIVQVAAATTDGDEAVEAAPKKKPLAGSVADKLPAKKRPLPDDDEEEAPEPQGRKRRPAVGGEEDAPRGRKRR